MYFSCDNNLSPFRNSFEGREASHQGDNNCDGGKIPKVIRKIILVLSLFALVSLNACNTVKGTATGVGSDVKAIWHYGTCAWDWDKDCQKKQF